MTRPEEPFTGPFEPSPLKRLVDAVASATAAAPAPAVVAVDAVAVGPDEVLVARPTG